ncbi:MAG: DUF3015 family protein [Gammaproteobacteria bacterium]|nr:DUF3015 family protein [Gammaproteobacteria bacterium]
MIKNNFKNVIAALAVGMILATTGCTTTDITSSTSSTVDAATPDVTLNRFVDVRIASIKKEAAAGEGENLEALAQLMGKQDKQAFSGWMQVNYDALFNNLKQPKELISRIEIVSIQTQKI